MLMLAALGKMEFITLGFGLDDPRLAAIDARFRTRKYHSRIYMVRWPGLGGPAGDLDSRPLCPEVALL